MSFETLMRDCADHASEQATQAERMAIREHELATEFRGAVLVRPESMIRSMVDLLGFSDIDANVMRAVAAAYKAGIPDAINVVVQMSKLYGEQNTFEGDV